jgi:hypothetical protein
LEGPEETQFYRLRGAEEVGGEFYILDGGNHEVRVFGPDGTFRRAFGRRGSGPGEFQNPSSLYVLGDTVIVQGRRLNLLDSAGEALATGPGRSFGEGGYLARTVPTARGWIGAWYTRRGEHAKPNEPFHETTSLHPVDPLTAELGPAFFEYDSPEWVLAGEISFYLEPFFQARPSSAIGSNGRVYYTPGDAYRIDVIDGIDGRLLRRIVSDFQSAPVSDALIDDAIANERERVRDAPPGSETAMFAKVVDKRIALPVPERLPVFGGFFYASPSGRLLVLREDLDEDPVRMGNPSVWDLFDADGRLQGRLTLPVGVLPLRLTDDALLARVRDELDVEYFVKYRLQVDPTHGPQS